MSINNLPNRLLNRLLLGDRKPEGFIRFLVLIITPLAVLLTNTVLTVFYGWSFAIGQIILLYFLGFISAFTTVVYYIGDIYKEEFDKIPFRYFMACFLGVFQPQIQVNGATLEPTWHGMVEKIGGPASLDIDPGFVVLTESLTAPEKVYGQGKGQFMSRYERIYEIIDLREQEGMVEKVTAITRDGIKVMVEKIKFNYRIWDSRWEGLYRDQSVNRNPYPYSKQAIFNYAYNRSVQLDAQKKLRLAQWPDVVSGRVQGLIKDYISEHKLDDVIASRDQYKKETREEIFGRAFQPGFRDGLRAVGTILKWWDPGEFRSQPDVEKQFISNWSVDIISDIKLNQAYGNAQKLAYEELGRAEAEAELLMSIIHAMDGVRMGTDKVQTLQNLILLRTAQVIKALNTPSSNEPVSKGSDNHSYK